MENSYQLPATSNQLPEHICQSPPWGEFKTKMGTPAIRVNGVQFTLHKIPLTKWNVGYCPKVDLKKIDWEELLKAAKKHNCIFIKVEPNAIKDSRKQKLDTRKPLNCVPGKALFRHHTLFLDLGKSEEDLLKTMHPKTRYNIKLAERRGVRIEEYKDSSSLKFFIELQKETARRDKFFVHPDNYYKTLWETLKPYKMVYLLIASIGTWPDTTPLAANLFLRYKNTFYYTFGGSASYHRNLMAPYLLMWEGIKLGKKLGSKTFDFWGVAPPKALKSDPWYGLTKFKEGFGGKYLEFAPTYDLVLNKPLYYAFNLADKIRWFVLNLRRKVRQLIVAGS